MSSGRRVERLRRPAVAALLGALLLIAPLPAPGAGAQVEPPPGTGAPEDPAPGSDAPGELPPLPPPPAPSAEWLERTQQQQQVQEQRAEVATEIDALVASDAEIEQALADLAARVAAERALLVDAQAELVEATIEREALRAEEVATAEEVVRLQGDLRDVAVDTFIRRGVAPVPVFTEAQGPARRRGEEALVDIVTVDVDEVSDDLERRSAELTVLRGEAEAAEVRAVERTAEVERQLVDLEAAEADQQALGAAVDLRIEAALSEAAALEQLDLELSLRILAEQQRLAEIAALYEIERLAAAEAAALRTVTVLASVEAPPLARVSGITVHAGLAPHLSALLQAAYQAGIALGGGGYRDSADQLRLRTAHCPDPINSAAGECSPPTARVGHSLHEQGLAIDFTYAGQLIQDRANPGYLWLEANGAAFGFHNLPSEPWHWSVNGN